MRDIVIFSTAEWDNPFWTNKQHMAKELARRGHNIFYIESVGLRSASLGRSDLGRIAARLKKQMHPIREVIPNLIVWSPLAFPAQRYALVRRLNRNLLNGQLAFLLRRHGFKPDVLWTYNPLTSLLLDTSMFRQIVYHCVDDIKHQPGMPSEVIAEAERELIERADVVFTTSRHLEASCKRLNPNTYYHSNVADFDHFSAALKPELPVHPWVKDLPQPIIGYIGALSGYKVDFGLIRHMAESRPSWTFVLIGKIGEGDPWTDISILKGLPNVHLPGPAAYAELPSLLKGFDVAMMPMQRNEYTRSMFPMKFFEYMAAGRPIVSSDLPALQEYTRVAYLANDYDDFILGIERCLEKPLDASSQLQMARQHTYASRTDQMMAILNWSNGD